ncbi:hypothetical protein [Geminocystis sp. NIES-3709]|uniref:hypothetical protein n=1 Tax=Geminocystis sp. NIES-3709 TaxID=1617448 RepID=UPI0005FC8D51|nr:hypothetical protein [Geminocystis sp. NIES-3709]BAQ66433.1 hypothetical protein GM3709_3198 [Geminocystis sp. NIES-3709]
MSSYSMFFVKNIDFEVIRRVHQNIEPVKSSSFVRCSYQKDANPPEDDVLIGNISLTQVQSKQLGEVIFIYGDTSIDGFVYEHARDGVLLRKLVWFPMLDDEWTAGWLCAVGEPESWEKVLFSSDRLERYIQNERTRYEDENRIDEFDLYEANIRADWASGRIIAGKTYPECDGTVTALVEQFII